MDTAIIAALIGAVAVIVAALINRYNGKKSKIIVKQKSKGNNNTQIGVQNNYGGKDNE